MAKVPVVTGDTLSSIAKENGTTVAAILADPANATIAARVAAGTTPIFNGSKVAIPATSVASTSAPTSGIVPNFTPTVTMGNPTNGLFVGPIPTGTTRTDTGYTPTVVPPPAGKTVVSSITNADGTITTTYSDGTSEITGTPNKPVVNKKVVNVIQNSDGTVTSYYDDGTSTISGTPTPKGITPTPQTGVTQTAKDVVSSFLKEAGMGALSDAIWSQWTSGTTAAQILDYVRTTPEYATRFPAMKTLNEAGRNISEASYIAKEQADIEIMRQAGISDAIATNRTLLGDLIKNNVNIVELQKRTLLAQDSILSKDPSVLKYAKDAFGLSAGDLMAFALAPEIALPVLEQQARAIQIGGAALQAGFATDMASNELKKSQAEALAAQGVTAEQAKTGFTNLAQMGQYGTALPGSNPAETLTQQELIDAQFGMSPEAIMKLQKAKQTKTAEFQQGGAFAATQAGVTGLGMGPSV